MSLFRPFHPPRKTVSLHEQIVFYPSYASRTTGGWKIVIQGVVFDSRMTWLRRMPVMGLIRRAMRVDHTALDFFRDRMRHFLLDCPHGRQIVIDVAGRPQLIAESGVAGLFRSEVTVSEDQLSAFPQEVVGGAPWVEFQAVLPAGDHREFTGRAQLVEPVGVSVISDVDDTIKHSNVPNRRDLFHNTFARSFRSVVGMPELYRDCHAAGAVFHYVSASPWQLFGPLSEFWQAEGFPPGSFHLKRFRIRDTARKLRMSRQVPHKRAAIAPILEAFPQRKFLLFGDSGEQDPEIYGQFLRERPQQIAGVFIRGIRGESRRDAKLQKAFAGTDESRWNVYADGQAMRDAALVCLNAARGSLPGSEG